MHSARLMLAISGQVRRKADPAKGLVKEWVSNWRDARPVSGDASHRQITGWISCQPGNVHIPSMITSVDLHLQRRHDSNFQQRRIPTTAR